MSAIGSSYSSRSFSLPFSLTLLSFCFLPLNRTYVLSKENKAFREIFLTQSSIPWTAQFACQKKFRLDIHREVLYNFLSCDYFRASFLALFRYDTNVFLKF